MLSPRYPTAPARQDVFVSLENIEKQRFGYTTDLPILEISISRMMLIDADGMIVLQCRMHVSAMRFTVKKLQYVKFQVIFKRYAPGANRVQDVDVFPSVFPWFLSFSYKDLN